MGICENEYKVYKMVVRPVTVWPGDSDAGKKTGGRVGCSRDQEAAMFVVSDEDGHE